MEPLRRRLLQDALSLFEDLLENGKDDPALRADTAFACARLGKICRLLGAYPEAEQRLRRAITMLTEIAAESPGDARPRAERIECRRQLGWVLSIQGRRKDAETVHREALADTELLAAEFPELPFYKHEIAHCCINLAATVSLSRPHESAELCRRAIQMAEGVPVNRYCLSQAHRMQGELLLRSNRHRAAEAEFRKALVVYDQMLRDEGDDWNRKLPKAALLHGHDGGMANGIGGRVAIGQAIRRGRSGMSRRCGAVGFAHR
jgi:tetratricopeptide (TPR) repeat protein